jgi:hypothetical protein
MALKFLGTLTITPATPQLLTSVAAIVAAGRGKAFSAIIIAQRRVNVGFVFVGDAAMAGEATATFTIPPSSASASPFAQIDGGPGGGANPVGIEGISVDGTAAEIVQISGYET